MKPIVIVSIIAICFQDVLCIREVRYSPQSDTTAQNPQLAQPVSIESITPDTPKPTSTTSANTPLAEIPFIPYEAKMVIKGENGIISVDGVLLYNDEEFSKGHVWLVVNKSNIRINGKIVAKYPRDQAASFPALNQTNKNVSKFEVILQSNGPRRGTVSFRKNGGPQTMWN